MMNTIFIKIIEEYEKKSIKIECKKCKTKFCAKKIVEKCPFCGHTKLKIEMPNEKNGPSGNLAIKETIMG